MFLCVVLSTQGQSTLDLAGGIGLSGPMLSTSYQFHPKWSMGSSVSYLHLKGATQTTLSGQSVNISAFLNFVQVGFFGKYHPMAEYDSHGYGKKSFFFARNSFYLKSGVFLRNKPVLTISSTFSEPLKVGDLTLTPDQTGKVDVFLMTGNIMAYAGMGLTLATPIKRFKIGMEAGSYYHGKPKVVMEASGALQHNSRNQEQLQRNLSFIQILPQIQIDFIYQLKKFKSNQIFK
jgi:hypothetical protein